MTLLECTHLGLFVKENGQEHIQGKATGGVANTLLGLPRSQKKKQK